MTKVTSDYHAPVFVLTHHPREPLTMRGGTTFTFVTSTELVTHLSYRVAR